MEPPQSRYAQLRQEYATILRKCARSRLLEDGRRVHARIIHSGHTRDRFLGNLLVQMYRDCGRLEDARAVFDSMPLRNEFSWAIIISAYVGAGKEQEALCLYRTLVRSSTEIQADAFIFSSVLAACARLKCLEQGLEIHERIVKRGVKQDVGLQNALVTMYAKCGRIDRAKQVFDRITHRDVVSWNAMVSANAEAGHLEVALKIYQEMVSAGVKPDAFTYASVLNALAGLGRIEEAVLLHSRLGSQIETDTIVGTALVSLYTGCGRLDCARSAFRKISRRDVLCWSTMISAEAMAGHDREALELYREMILSVRPNASTLATVLAACTRLGDLSSGALVRDGAIQSGLDRDAVVGTTLVNLYARFGDVIAAREVFDRIKARDTISWTAMVAAYAQHGHGRQAMEIFQALCLEGIHLDEVAFTNILGACSHSGLLDEIWECFVAMRCDHGIHPGAEHYRCLISALGRSGRIGEAEELIKSMPFQTDSRAWMALLDACKTHKSFEVGAGAGSAMLQSSRLGGGDGSLYVAVSNLYDSHC
ncbi:pentatricopeptide repeat-containing protein At2g33680-like [Selaginella moellendorffii]|uniref:pentatricopeptide repeat-containing protein At2g33680-like n=1 Tax=Selaginella moellendorffii TaxID=88036 RepID=UPI000D1D0F5F|nr:pentatricopeptide repeat-containing protein At2g33680-like [Selaginella moellendorffii]|eukprot:XP_024533752.1 pentatricopeptide repeat-containing protein At2g33680-like [Selaginella moellendorffii]